MTRQPFQGGQPAGAVKPGIAHRHAATGRSNHEEARPSPGRAGGARHHDGKKHPQK
jgi:hypothetical protein